MNLQPNELRIGNYVYANNVDDNKIVFQQIQNGADIDNAKWYWAVELTEELLLRCGLKPNEWFCCDGYCVVEDRDADTHYGWCMKVRNASHTREIEFGYFKYLHQLQNLYFALTGEELTLKD